MEDWSSVCSNPATKSQVVSTLESIGLSSHIEATVLNHIQDKSVRVGELNEAVRNIISSPELLTPLKNTVYSEVIRLHDKVGVSCTDPAHHCKEPLDFVRDAQISWESKLKRGINTLCTEKNLHLCKQRTASEREHLRRKWHSIGSEFPGLQEVNPIYSPKDFLETLIRVCNPNNTQSGVESGAEGLMKLNLNVKPLLELRSMFSCLRPSNTHVETSLAKNGGTEYYEKSEKVLRNGLCPLARQLCKGGCPVGLRRELWSKALAVAPGNPEHAFRFEELKMCVLNHSILFEKLLVMDVKKIAANDDNYFVFEDTMHQVLLCFLHDEGILAHYSHLSPTPMKAYLTGHTGDSSYETVHPPNGVIPFHGFSQFIAPLCFLFDRPDRLYVVFKELYLKFFVHLHSISSHEQGILGLCCQFEHLFQCKQPELFQHLVKIGAPP